MSFSKEPTVVNLRTNSHTLYIGRGSKWGNPFVIGKDGDRATVIAKYRKYLWSRKDLLDALPELEGHTLGCYCKPSACHGDVLIKALRWYNQQNA